MIIKFNIHTGILVPMNIQNIDTDVIIPKQFLKKITKSGFGKHLFHDWRYLDNEGKIINSNFVLNKICYKNASILLTGSNFGCGSSREHAVWALKEYGIKTIIAPSFGDIFYNNAFNNHLLLIMLSENKINELFSISTKNVGIKSKIDLIKQEIIIDNKKYFFKIDNFYRKCMLNGVDHIDLTLKHDKKIDEYETNIPDFFFNLAE